MRVGFHTKPLAMFKPDWVMEHTMPCEPLVSALRVPVSWIRPDVRKSLQRFQ
jgi:hypothetical protein